MNVDIALIYKTKSEFTLGRAGEGVIGNLGRRERNSR